MTFAASFTVKKPSLMEWVRHAINPSHFSIHSSSLPALLAVHHHDAANTLLGKPSCMSDKKGEGIFNQKEQITLYYPGCGQDMVWPLLILNAIACGTRRWNILCQDLQHTLGAHISTVQQLTGNSVHSATKHPEGEGACFTFKDKEVTVLFVHGDALEGIPKEVSKGYDVYFERGFEFCRSQSPGFIEEATSTLKPNGLLITDNALLPLPPFLIPLPHTMPPWGFYKKPMIYMKK